MQQLPAMSRGMGCGPLTRRHHIGNRPLIWLAVAAATLGGCGSSGEKSSHAPPPAQTVRLTSTDFTPGGRLPKADTCDGAGRKPALRITAVPSGAKALALIVHDPDAP